MESTISVKQKGAATKKVSKKKKTFRHVSRSAHSGDTRMRFGACVNESAMWIQSAQNSTEIRLRPGAVTGVLRRHAHRRLRTWALPADNHRGIFKHTRLYIKWVLAFLQLSVLNADANLSHNTSKTPTVLYYWSEVTCRERDYFLHSWLQRPFLSTVL